MSMQRSAAINAIKSSNRWKSTDGSARLLADDHSLRPLTRVDPYEGEIGLAKDLAVLKDLLFGGWISVLLICIPLGLVSDYLGWGAVATFTLNFLALIPLALILGDVTEDLAARFGDVIGGLLNATFGNVVEVILSIAALEKGLYRVVSASLVGSILSNLLLVLGCCFLFGGAYHKTQTFNAMGNRVCGSLLFLAVIGVVTPTAAYQLVPHAGTDTKWIVDISRIDACILLAIYLAYLVFQLYTHTELFNEPDGGGDGSDGEEDEEEANLSLPAALLMLTGITVCVSFCSEFLTGSIEEVSSTTGLGDAFLGMIVLPIAGNACEHITAVIVAMKNKMDLALGVAMGSSLQIALFAMPLCVVVGWATGHAFTLSLDPFMAVILAMSVIQTSVVTSDATVHWLLGVQLIAVYVIVAAAYFYI